MRTRNSTAWLLASVIGLACDAPTLPDGGTSWDAGRDSGPVEPCTRDSECGDQSMFCAEWRCRRGEPGTDARGCIDLGPPCGAGEGCDEELRRCGAYPAWCTEGRAGCLAPGDCDGDLEPSPECGGHDCDDDDGDRYPGNDEVCDADGHDEDCEDTVGVRDEDGDGATSSACCNGVICGPDCDDSRRDVHPGATELCNAIDDDCDGAVDEAGAFCPVGSCVDRRCRAVTWERVYGGTGNDGPSAVAVDPSGNVYVTFISPSPLDLDDDGVVEPGGPLFLLSLSAEGRFRWVVAGAGDQIVARPDGLAILAVEGGGSTVAWYSTADGALIRRVTLTTPEGWDRLRIRGVGASETGIVLAAQLERLDPDDPLTTVDGAVLLRRIDDAGSTIAERLIDAPGPDAVGVGAIDASSAGVLLAGGTSAPLDLDGTRLPGGAFLARLGGSFDLVWSVGVPGGVVDVALSALGEAAIVGQFRSTFVPPWGAPTWVTAETAAFAVSFAPDGAHRWTRLHGGSTADTFRGAAFDGRGGLLVSGDFSGTLDVRPRGDLVASGTCDAFFAVWAAVDGFTLDARRFTGPGCETITSVAIDPYAGMIIGGFFGPAITLLSGTSYASRGMSDAFVVRVSDTP